MYLISRSEAACTLLLRLMLEFTTSWLSAFTRSAFVEDYFTISRAGLVDPTPFVFSIAVCLIALNGTMDQQA